ncbi:hypothetical protein AGR5A_Cc20261 [Agrobacterium genomosp. 5 str. CFBP 6626]|nr:hypothetical protein AGR5A_Cc20261 [Agrobacterium genomosp. 5 str. CFBP 6626]
MRFEHPAIDFALANFSSLRGGKVSITAGVGQPVKPVSDVRSTDARRRKRDRPDSVTHGFQVILYKVDPRVCVLTCNLLSKDDWRATLLDEVEERRP